MCGANRFLGGFDADFHPGGQTALIVGERGVVLRYAKQDQSLERAASDFDLDYSKMISVAWNTAGSWAYVGTDDGQLMRETLEKHHLMAVNTF